MEHFAGVVGPEMHKYVRARAAYEKVGCELDEAFFVAHVTAGSMPMFGVWYDTEGLVDDEQFPNFFRSYWSKKDVSVLVRQVARLKAVEKERDQEFYSRKHPKDL